MTQFIISMGSEQQGPYSFDDILMYEKIGEVTSQTPVRLADHDIWKKWEDIKIERAALEQRKKLFENSTHEISAALSSAAFLPSTRIVKRDGPQLSRSVYIVLALFLGMAGIHNFYAGHSARGVIQLLLTLAGIGLAVSGIYFGLVFMAVVTVWVLAEIVMEKEDAYGRSMR